MKTFSILNEATDERTDCQTLAAAQAAAKAAAAYTDYDHSVWECVNDGMWTNTGDYYNGERGKDLE